MKISCINLKPNFIFVKMKILLKSYKLNDGEFGWENHSWNQNKMLINRKFILIDIFSLQKILLRIFVGIKIIKYMYIQNISFYRSNWTWTNKKLTLN